MLSFRTMACQKACAGCCDWRRRFPSERISAPKRRKLTFSKSSAKAPPKGCKVRRNYSGSWEKTSRSEERRVGKEGRSRGSPDHLKKKRKRWRSRVSLK